MSVGTLNITSPTVVNRDFSFGGTLAANTLTLSGPMNLSAGAHTISVANPQVIGVISGRIIGGTNLVKSGPGTLTISANGLNDYGGTSTVASGVLRFRPAAPLPAASSIFVNPGAVLDLNASGITTAAVGSLNGDTLTTGGIITNGTAGSATLRFGGDNVNAVFPGLITNAANALGLIKASALGLFSRRRRHAVRARGCTSPAIAPSFCCAVQRGAAARCSR